MTAKVAKKKKAGEIHVTLRAGHPKGMMRARLTDGSVIEIGREPVKVAADLVSDEMRATGWFQVDGKPLAAAAPKADDDGDDSDDDDKDK